MARVGPRSRLLKSSRSFVVGYTSGMSFDRIDRRRFFLLAAAPLLAAQKAAVPLAREALLQLNGYAVNAETPLELLTDYLTPVDLFFIRSHWIPRMPDLGSWSLSVDGE